MTDAQHRKSFAASRRSILKGLGAAAIGITLTGKTRRAFADEEKKLNFYNWDTYIGETTLEDFKNVSGIDVNMSLFATNDELFAKLRAGNPGYDVIVPGSEFVERMIQANMLGVDGRGVKCQRSRACPISAISRSIILSWRAAG